MDNTDVDLVLKKQEAGCSIDLPNSDWQLILKCKGKVSGKGGLGRQSSGIGARSSSSTVQGICDDLIHILKVRRDLGMTDFERRSLLLRRFEPWQLSRLVRHDTDMEVDLRKIVDYVARELEQLDNLIEEAMSLAQTVPTKDGLSAIKAKYDQFRLDQASFYHGSQVIPEENDV